MSLGSQLTMMQGITFLAITGICALVAEVITMKFLNWRYHATYEEYDLTKRKQVVQKMVGKYGHRRIKLRKARSK